MLRPLVRCFIAPSRKASKHCTDGCTNADRISLEDLIRGELKLPRKLAEAMRHWQDCWHAAEAADIAEEQGWTPEADPSTLATIADDAERAMFNILEEWEAKTGRTR